MRNYLKKNEITRGFKGILLFIFTVAVLRCCSNELTMKSDRRLNTELEQLYATDLGCVSRRHNLVYVHIPKTGGTTIEKSPLFDDVRVYREKGIRTGTGGHHSVGLLMTDAEERGIAHFQTAAHVRHPCERFISAFRYLTSDKCNDGDKLWSNENIGDMTIDEFVEMAEEKSWKPFGEIHFNRQYRFVVDDGIFRVDHILCQEQWDEGMSRLYTSIGLEHSEKRDEQKLKNPHEHCTALKESTRQALERFYAMDYCLFDYPPFLKDGPSRCLGSTFSKEDFQARYDACSS